MDNLWIRRRRKEIHITQLELATRLVEQGYPCTEATISHWELGRHSPPLDDVRFVEMFAKALHLSIRDLLDLAGYQVTNTPKSKYAEQAAYLVDQMNPDKQHLAVKVLEAMLEK